MILNIDLWCTCLHRAYLVLQDCSGNFSDHDYENVSVFRGS
jgi:hypothetical protein